MMMRRLARGITAILCIAAALPATTTRAGFQTYELTYSGAAFGNNATAIATITLDLTELVNPGFTEQDVSPFVTAFSITVSGANLGNGTFGIGNYLGWPENFGGFILDTNGGLLDFTRELFGQPTAGLPYGSSSSGNAGDFAIVANLDNHDFAAPISGAAFQIYTNGGYNGFETLSLTSFRPTAVPEPASLTMLGLGAVGLVGYARKRCKAAIT
jgi:PEP-CTERM motif